MLKIDILTNYRKLQAFSQAQLSGFSLKTTKRIQAGNLPRAGLKSQQGGRRWNQQVQNMLLQCLLALGPDYQYLPKTQGTGEPGTSAGPRGGRGEDMLIYVPQTVFSFRKYFGYLSGKVKAGCQKNQTFPLPKGGLMLSLNS